MGELFFCTCFLGGVCENTGLNAYYMGLLHDIGKIGIPNEIINSPTRLFPKQCSGLLTVTLITCYMNGGVMVND